jgi:homogentisate 1,2-dioxygenase
MLFVPEQGALLFRTEFGNIEAKPNEIVVIPRGIKFSVDLLDKVARGYICENYGSGFYPARPRSLSARMRLLIRAISFTPSRRSRKSAETLP